MITCPFIRQHLDDPVPETRIILEGQTTGALGCTGTTPIHLYERSDKERTMDLKPGDTRRPRCEVRTGVAIFGGSNMTAEEMEAVGHNPFHPAWCDNFAWGEGNTEEEALESLKKWMGKTSESLFI